MPSEDSPATLVARFLRSNNYIETLAAFLAEAGLPLDTGTNASDHALTIEQILQEKKVFDVSLAFEKVNLDDERNKAWTSPAPSVPTVIETLPAASNILHVAVESVCQNPDDGEERHSSLLVASGADRSINFLSPVPPFHLDSGRIPVSESPILSTTFLSLRYCITSSMSGKVLLHDLKNVTILDERRDHSKYVVKVVSTRDDSGVWIATAAWDSRVLVYHIRHLSEECEDMKLGEPIAEISMQTNPEAILFLTHPEISTPVLLVSRRDSTILYYYTIPHDVYFNRTSDPVKLELLGRQNLAPHSNAWVAFTPSAFCISPKDPSILAVATSAVPDMKLIIVRLLLPPPKLSSPGSGEPPTYLTQAAQLRGNLALEDREAAAILIHCSTSAPQTPYSTPSLAWRPDASGIFVNGDDGVVRGIEASSGKIISILKTGHEPGTKIRCLWAGWADDEMKDEIIVSGGFDRRLVVWRVEREGA